MSKKRWGMVGVLAVVVFACIGVFLALNLFPGNRVYSNIHGDAGLLDVVGVSANRWSQARFQGDGDHKGATVKLGEQTARVTAERVELTGGRVISIPAGCKTIELRESRDGLRVFLDGIETR